MDRDSANQISELIRLHLDELGEFRLEKTFDTPLKDFHEWADGHECLGAYRIRAKSGPISALHVLFVEWLASTRPGEFYLIVYRSARSRGPVYEIHKVSNGRLVWKYVPRRRDGKNPERKKRFGVLALKAGLLQDSSVEVRLPENAADLADFLQSLFRLVEIRDEAHDLESPIGIDLHPSAKAVFKAANATGSYAAIPQKTGFQLQYGGRPAWGVGGEKPLVCPESLRFF